MAEEGSNGVYTVSQKNIPDIFSCNSRKRCQIFVMFGTRVTEKLVLLRYLYLR